MAEFITETKNIFLEIFVPQAKNDFLPKVLKSKYLFWYGASLLIIKIALISLTLILPSTSFFSSITTNRLISLINQERQAKNLPALTLSNNLNSVAGLKVNDMLTRNYFEHTSPAGVTPWFWFKKIGYNYQYAGENLAMGFTQTDDVFNAWISSPTHRDNILNPNYQEMGLAVGTANIQNYQKILAVLVFGKQVQQSKTKIAQNTPSKNIVPSTSPIALKSSPAASPKPAILSPIVPVISIVPPATSGIAPEKSPAEQIVLKTILSPEPKIQSNKNQPINPLIKTGYAPKILGAFSSRSDEIFKSLYLYFTLFLAIALLINIFVKIKIQYWTTITATTLIILLSLVLIFI